MKVIKEIDIPEGLYCDDCPCFLEQLDSYSYEESHNWCFYLGRKLNNEIPLDDKKTKKPRKCPAFELRQEVPK